MTVAAAQRRHTSPPSNGTSHEKFPFFIAIPLYESFATVGEIRVYWRADFQSGSRVLKKVF